MPASSEKALNEARWERLRPRITQVYIIDGNTLEATMKLMADEVREAGLIDPSKKQYLSWIKRWKLVKNVKSKEWESIHQCLVNRSSSMVDGQQKTKSSLVIQSGRALTAKKVQKAVKRHRLLAASGSLGNISRVSERALTPARLKATSFCIRTPPPNESRDTDWWADCSWFRFQGQLRRFVCNLAGAKGSVVDIGPITGDLVNSQRSTGKAELFHETITRLNSMIPGLESEELNSLAHEIFTQRNQYLASTNFSAILYSLANGLINPTETFDNSITTLIKALAPRHDALQQLSRSDQPSGQALFEKIYASVARAGDQEAVKLLCDTGANLESTVDAGYCRFNMGEKTWYYRATILELAIAHQNNDLVQLLIEHRGDTFVDLLSSTKWLLNAALHARGSDMTILKSLLAYLKFQDLDQWHRALKLSTAREAESVVDILLSSDDVTAIFTSNECLLIMMIAAIFNGRTQLIEKLTARDIDYSYPVGCPPISVLSAAVAVEDYQFVESLLRDLKVPVDDKDIEGRPVYSGIHYAIRLGNLPLMKLLIRYGANVNHGLDIANPFAGEPQREFYAANDVYEILSRPPVPEWHKDLFREAWQKVATPLEEAIFVDNLEAIILLQQAGAVATVSELLLSMICLAWDAARHFLPSIKSIPLNTVESCFSHSLESRVRVLEDAPSKLKKKRLCHFLFSLSDQHLIQMVTNCAIHERDLEALKCLLKINSEPTEAQKLSFSCIVLAEGDLSLAEEISGGHYHPGLLCTAVHMATFTRDVRNVIHLLRKRPQTHCDPSYELLEGTAMAIAVSTASLQLMHLLLQYGIRPCPAYAIPSYLHDFRSPLTLAKCKRLNLWWLQPRHQQERDLMPVIAMALRTDGVDIGIEIRRLQVQCLIDLGHCIPCSLAIARAVEIGDLQLVNLVMYNAPREARYHALCSMALGNMIIYYNSRKDVTETREAQVSIINAVYSPDSDYKMTEKDEFVSTRVIARTPLQAAAGKGDLEIVNLLLEKGADVNIPTCGQAGVTALQAAILGGSIGIVKLLLDRGAQCNAPRAEAWGRTALEAAAEHGRLDMLDLLRQSGVSIEGDFGQMQFVRAICLAKSESHHSTAAYLTSWREWTIDDKSLLDDLERVKPDSEEEDDILYGQEVLSSTDEEEHDDSEYSYGSEDGEEASVQGNISNASGEDHDSDMAGHVQRDQRLSMIARAFRVDGEDAFFGFQPEDLMMAGDI